MKVRSITEGLEKLSFDIGAIGPYEEEPKWFGQVTIYLGDEPQNTVQTTAPNFALLISKLIKFSGMVEAMQETGQLILPDMGDFKVVHFPEH